MAVPPTRYDVQGVSAIDGHILYSCYTDKKKQRGFHTTMCPRTHRFLIMTT
jgi:hypothetical protein